MVILYALIAVFGFQGVDLGTSEDRLRAIFPTLGCSGEMRFLRVTPEEAAAGTKVCTPTEMIGESRVPVDPSVGTYRGAVRYFVTNGVVARIEFWPDYPAAESVLAGLTQKYGPPKELKRGVAEAVGGRQVPSINAVWKEGDQTIVLEAPSVNLQKMTVTYRSGLTTERIVPAKM